MPQAGDREQLGDSLQGADEDRLKIGQFGHGRPFSLWMAFDAGASGRELRSGSGIAGPFPEAAGDPAVAGWVLPEQ
jgi:hypothetical protein